VTNLISCLGRGPKAVVPGLPTRGRTRKPGDPLLGVWIPGSATPPRNDGLKFVTNQYGRCRMRSLCSRPATLVSDQASSRLQDTATALVQLNS
jgi:hypothetical protein